MWPFDVDPYRKWNDRNPFVEDGFQTGEMTIPIFEMPITLRQSHYLRFDGVVPNLYEYLLTLSPDIQEIMKGTIQLVRENPTWGGFNSGITTERHKGFLVAVSDVSPRVNAFNIAHEYAEALYRMGYGSELESILRENGLPGMLYPWLESHHIGMIAGYIGARKQGFDFSDGLIADQDPEGWRFLIDMGLVE